MNLMQSLCFHCGLPVPANLDLTVNIDKEARPMCCRGCQAVALAIVDNGLVEYYRSRTAPAQTGHEILPAELRQLALYDHPDIQKSFVIDAGPHTREAVLILEGITCAACIWLNERHLMQLPGVKSVQVNYATHRARVSWDEQEIQLSKILAEIQLLGYNAHPYSAQGSEALRKKTRKHDLRRLAVAGISAAQVMMLAVGLYAGNWYGIDAGMANVLRYFSLLLTLPVMVYAAVPFYRGAWSALRMRRLNMDVPVTLALVSAFIGSAWMTLRGGGHVYYDAITMFTLFLLATRFLEKSAQEKSVETAENLLKLAPAMATRIRDGEQETVAVAGLALGDTILSKPGEAIAADAVVLTGESSVDEALLTGESRAVLKGVGSNVIAGSINLEGPLMLSVTGVGEHTVLASIVRLLDKAQAEKPRLAQLLDRVASYFTAVLLALTLAIGLAWWWVDAARAFEIVLAVLVVTCPCALSLAAPAALAAAGSRLLGEGVLLTRGHALETCAQVNHVVFDKTGTLTFGKPVLQQTLALSATNAQQCLRLAASLEQASEHPLAASFLAQLKRADLLPVREPQNMPGKGVAGVIEGVRYTLGNRNFSPCSQAVDEPKIDTGATLVWLCNETQALAVFVIADEVRPEAAALVENLKHNGIHVSILSGDGEAAVRHVAGRVGIEAYQAELRPEDKLVALKLMQQKGGIVAMVGDGVNDAPVLAGAQLSIAMGNGAQVARASSDIVLLSENLLEIARALETGRAAMTVMRQNIGWAIAYNLIALPFAALGFVPPWLASLGMSTSSLVVVLNAMRLR